MKIDEVEIAGARQLSGMNMPRHTICLFVAATIFVAPAASAREPLSGPQWLAGDHHIHSRFSVGWDKKTDPPTPVLSADAAYPIPMNAIMARRFGLSWMVATDHGGPNHSKVNLEHAYPELIESRKAVPEVIRFYGNPLFLKVS